MKKTLFVFLFIGMTLRIVMAWMPFFDWQTERGGLIDDSFYYFQIARNIATGNGPTHDGVAMTSGFQPLWMGILVPVYVAVPNDPILPIHLALTLNAIFALVSGILLWKLGSHLGSERGGVIAAGIWMLSPYALNHGMNGMETELTGMLILATLYFYLKRIRTGKIRSIPNWSKFGLLAGLTWLARADTALFLLPLGIDFIISQRPWRQGWSGYHGPILAVFVAFTIVLPWVAFCLVVSGAPLPESGKAVRLLSHMYANNQVHGYSMPGTAGFYLDNLALLARGTLSRPELSAGIPFGYLCRRLGPKAFPQIVGWLALLPLFVILWRKNGKVRFPTFIWGAVALYLFGYAVLVPGQWFYGRYIFPLVLLGTLLSGLMATILIDSLPRRYNGWQKISIITVAVALVGAAYTVDTQRRFGRTDGANILGYYETSEMIDNTYWIEEPVGVFQAGVIGYFCKKSIVALDGKVNTDARKAMEHGRLVEYTQEVGVKTITDFYSWITTLSLESSGGRIQYLERIHDYRPFSWVVAKIRKKVYIATDL